MDNKINFLPLQTQHCTAIPRVALSLGKTSSTMLATLMHVLVMDTSLSLSTQTMSHDLQITIHYQIKSTQNVTLWHNIHVQWGFLLTIRTTTDIWQGSNTVELSVLKMKHSRSNINYHINNSGKLYTCIQDRIFVVVN